jgi:isocitrate dehydrogenase (NAD+)
MTHTITLIYGDGIGPEVVHSARLIVEASGADIRWQEQLLGLKALEKYKEPVPPDTIEAIKETKVALKGPTTTPNGSGHKSANVTLRKLLDLYACIRPVTSVPYVNTPFSNIDLVVVRENTEGLYAGPEIMLDSTTAISFRVMTEKACKRIAKMAFHFAKNANRHKVTAAHKANILKLGDGLWLNALQNTRRDFLDIAYEEVIIDSLAMRLITQPTHFDVIVLENMFGDIISDLCAGLVGGLGLVPGANIGDEMAVFEAVHGSAPDIADKDLANPCAMILSSAMMLKHLGEITAAHEIERALFAVLEKKALRTRDLGGQSGTRQFTKEVISALKVNG